MLARFTKQFKQYLIFVINTINEIDIIVPFDGIHYLIDNDSQWVYIYLNTNNG